jgi:hypothetical protein
LRIVMLKGPSQYEGTRTFIDHAAQAFAARGFSVDVIDLAGLADVFAPIHAAATAGPCDLVYSINIFGEMRDGQGRSTAQIFGAPHVVWHVDYILSQETRLAATPRDARLLLVDPSQVEAVKSIYGAERYAVVDFCPHAAVGEAAADDADPEAFAAARPIPLLWAGSLQKTKARPWAAAAPGPRKVFDDAYDLALSVEWMPPHQALDTVLAARGLDLADPDNRGARTSAKLIDIEVRKTRRFEFVKALAKTGLPIHICGLGWESDLYRFKAVTYDGETPMPRVNELMRRSRVVLNTNGNFGAGSHERPLSALLAGAAPFSDYSGFYADALGEDEGIRLFRWRDLAAGMGALEDLATNPQAAWSLARIGKARVLAGHTWAHRVDPILRAAGIGAPVAG